MHCTPLNHDIPFVGDRLSNLSVQAFSVNDVERRRWRENCDCALHDDHVIG